MADAARPAEGAAGGGPLPHPPVEAVPWRAALLASDGEQHVRRLFLLLLGFVYLAAFLSLWSQIEGLVGEQGILPVSELMDTARRAGDGSLYRQLPTLLWLDASDTTLHLLCAAGTLLALLLVANVAPALVLAGLWVVYLSLAVGCQLFCNYQWDALLLETGLHAVFLAPWCLWPRAGAPAPPRLAVWLLRWLLFRLLFASGLVKLASGDPTWSHLTALRFHYETQPLPTWIGWYAHQLPLPVHQLSAAAMFAIELLVPFCIFMPRRCRHLAFWPLVGLQALIALTGNYAFFNLLSIALCFLLVDDEALERFLRRLLPQRLRGLPPRLAGRGSPLARFAPRDVQLLHRTGRPPRAVQSGVARAQPLAVLAFAVLVFVTSGVRFTGQLVGFQRLPRPLLQPVIWTSPLRSINHYGLFSIMTTRRAEIVLEGSHDGVTWLPYEFRCKPGDLRRRPGFVAPHQPRLDWQMWFAALDDPRRTGWFLRFEQRLLEGSPAVRALLAHDPFADSPPRQIRALLYDYRFTDRSTRRRDGAWWRRELLGEYAPVATLAGRSRPG